MDRINRKTKLKSQKVFPFIGTKVAMMVRTTEESFMEGSGIFISVEKE